MSDAIFPVGAEQVIPPRSFTQGGGHSRLPDCGEGRCRPIGGGHGWGQVFSARAKAPGVVGNDEYGCQAAPLVFTN